MIRIKVCGITNLQDAVSICKEGVDALGFILSDSPRRIELPKAYEISNALPPFVSRVAVVVNPTEAQLREIEESRVFDYVQLHGSEDAELIKKCRLKVIKAIKLDSEKDCKDILVYQDLVDYFLFDTKTQNAIGGTGRTFDWRILEKVKLKRPFILAGGLGPENIAEAIEKVRPNAVDLNSRVEKYPGKKDIELVRKTIRKIREVSNYHGE
ncbi:MAG TPA: phosphoribosylanthranilate isomerase [Fervidobacterium sp.]|nr:phosphoribosylanthranilate isomerase [Fervidobacterium sp.]